MRRLTRVRFMLATALAGALPFAVGCAPGSAQKSNGTGATIKIGLLAPTTGPLTANGTDMINGWNLYWSQNGQTVAGKKVETLTEDTAGNPSVALNKANQLADSQHVNMIVGPLSAAEGLAVADAMSRKNVITVMPIVSADDLTQRKQLKGVIRLAGWTSSQTAHPFGEYAYQQGHRRIVTIGYDFAFGYEGVGGFVNTFTDNGGTIVKQLWAPLGTQDYSTYVTQIKQAAPDATFAFLSGADAVRFFQAYKDFGLLGTVPLLGGETLTDQSVLSDLGDSAIGLVTSGHFAEGRDTPETQDFVTKYVAKYNRYPSYYSADAYTAARGIADAINGLHGDLSNNDKVIQALQNVSLSSTPMGPEKLDSYGNPIFNVYVRTVQRGPRGLWNVPTKTYEQVSQFWTYDPQQFLRHPVYSKTYQGNGAWPNPTS
jgi:branched-chain amino acid transport system substrate-binding protein